MKSLLVIAMALVSVSSFAADHKDAAHKAAMEACKEHSKDKKAMEACVTEKMKAPAMEASAPAAAPAPAHK
ncbi:hypothetical protein SHI21_06485 [Bacteriovorax sp. PP10]|uniref:PsiF repeat-containing protein n=1 Tax=Bacteriovorax antarcticus TaxID=3088717 RepID=A0ABU5VS07_9BACT|nr:hypothetical protein [Bacteriovorax sp. PP10]MEA9355837.1 hypothetical protein [Bacteriovorax sp. PP10]